MLSSRQVSSSLRVLTLALNLIHTPGGLSVEEALKKVPGYLPAQHDSARRMFERDVAGLREVGLVVEVSEDPIPTYRISSSTLSDTSVGLSDPEVSLLLRAADMWGISKSASTLLRHKLSGHAWGPLPKTASANMRLNEDGAVAVLLSALERRQIVEFGYAAKWGTSTRSVLPWRMVAKGKALYLWGFDMDRWDGRLFRLSRFTSVPELLGEPGDSEPSGEFQEQDFDQSAFLVAPLLLVQKKNALASYVFSEPSLPSLRSESELPERGEGVETPLVEEPDEGEWTVRRGTLDDTATWEDRLFTEAKGVCVISPSWLKESVREHLQVSSQWEVGRDG